MGGLEIYADCKSHDDWNQKSNCVGAYAEDCVITTGEVCPGEKKNRGIRFWGLVRHGQVAEECSAQPT
jgi:hypothetical protein